MPAANQTIVHLVDDDDAVRDSLKLLLESYGLEVRDHSSALGFLEKMPPTAVGCLVLDLHLPVVSGLDLIGIMKERGIRIPVVLITGRSEAETKARALQSGVIQFLEKPVAEETLIPAVRSALDAANVNGPAKLQAAVPS